MILCNTTASSWAVVWTGSIITRRTWRCTAWSASTWCDVGFFLLLVFGFLTIILELSMARSSHLLIAKINVVVVVKIENALEFMVLLKNVSELITIS